MSTEPRQTDLCMNAKMPGKMLTREIINETSSSLWSKYTFVLYLLVIEFCFYLCQEKITSPHQMEWVCSREGKLWASSVICKQLYPCSWSLWEPTAGFVEEGGLLLSLMRFLLWFGWKNPLSERGIKKGFSDLSLGLYHLRSSFFLERYVGRTENIMGSGVVNIKWCAFLILAKSDHRRGGDKDLEEIRFAARTLSRSLTPEVIPATSSRTPAFFSSSSLARSNSRVLLKIQRGGFMDCLSFLQIGLGGFSNWKFSLSQSRVDTWGGWRWADCIGGSLRTEECSCWIKYLCGRTKCNYEFFYFWCWKI